MAASAPMPTSDNVVQQGLPGGSRRASLKHEHAARLELRSPVVVPAPADFRAGGLIAAEATNELPRDSPTLPAISTGPH